MIRIIIFFACMCAAFAMGAIGGVLFEKDIARAKEAAADQAIVKQAKVDIPKVIERSNAIEASIDKSNDSIQVIKAKVRQRIQVQQEKANESPVMSTTEVATVSCAPFTLDVGTVRLLNAARQGTDVESASGSDEALATSSNIGIEKLLENDLEIVRLYRDLAKRHDELVDAVTQKLQKQAQ